MNEDWQKVLILVSYHETVTLYARAEKTKSDYTWVYAQYAQDEIHTRTEHETDWIKVVKRFHQECFWSWVPIFINYDDKYRVN